MGCLVPFHVELITSKRDRDGNVYHGMVVNRLGRKSICHTIDTVNNVKPELSKFFGDWEAIHEQCFVSECELPKREFNNWSKDVEYASNPISAIAKFVYSDTPYAAQFAIEHGLRIHDVWLLQRLGIRYAEFSTKEMNGEAYGTETQKCVAAKKWKAHADKVAKQMSELIKLLGFDHLDFGVGLFPTIQKTKSDTTQTIHFVYEDSFLNEKAQ